LEKPKGFLFKNKTKQTKPNKEFKLFYTIDVKLPF